MADRHFDDWRSDPLERPRSRRLVVVAPLLGAGLAFVSSSRRRDPSELPGVALDWPLLLDLERAVIVGAIVAILMIFAIRGWRGYFPSKLSTNGAEYGHWPSAESVSRSSEETSRALADLRVRQAAIARALQRAIDDLAMEMNDL